VTETHAEHSLDALEHRAATLLAGLREGRQREHDQRALLDDLTRQRDTLQASLVESDARATHAERRQEQLSERCDQRDQRVRELEAALDDHRARLQAEHEARDALQRSQEQMLDERLEQARQADAQRLADLAQRLEASERQRLTLFEENSELAEENRELDEQNRELEAYNSHLRERTVREDAGQSPSTQVFSRPARRAQGLAALMQHRPRHGDEAAQPQSDGQPGRLGAIDEGAPGAAPGVSSGGSEQGGAGIADAAGSLSVAARQATTTDPLSPEPTSPPAVPTEASCQGDLAIDKAPSPQALLTEWYERYASTFFKGHTRPLKVGIHEDLASREPWPEKLVRRALACYVNLPRYLKSVREGAERIDLGGQLDGVVDAQAADHAKRKLDRLQAERQRGSGQGPKRGSQARKGEHGKGAAPPRPGSGTAAIPAGRQEPPQASRHDASSLPSGSGGRPPAAGGEPEEQRLQRKLDELMARHNDR